ncbi:ABC transporter ATP-binding protein [Mammaliicoccus sciuri]|uniref:ABC-type multidrug transport system, ATPase component n=1 Tax=Sporosarcina newyorkensis TaxID=759851 RepID=A0A1T4YMH9_9BACL|nr:ABC transporter ATP-binding protein [Sporosarcina newyorkensis]SKB02471.1 ABC-type multidrug transport system, ATPase component [Sporosarcina newyorkensis]
MSVVLEARNVSKDFDGNRLFENISFTCKKKSVLFVQGSNGSGKSTLLKVLAGIYEPTDGKVIRNTNKIGYVPEHFPEGIRFKVKEYLSLTASFHAAEEGKEQLIANYVDLFDLSPFLSMPLEACSKGTKQKVGIIQALLMRPEILLLDEPLTGLDLKSQQTLISVLQEIRGQMPILFTAHDEGLVSQMATDILHISSGKMTSYQPHFKKEKWIRVQFIDEKDLGFIPPNRIQFDGNTALITVDQEKSDELLLKLLQMNCSILEVKEKA